MLLHKMKVISTDKVGGAAAPYWVYVDGEMRAQFVKAPDADDYASGLRDYERIDCCRSSRNSNGWHHDSDCVNWVMTF